MATIRHSSQSFSTLFGRTFIWMIAILKYMTVAPVCSLNLPRLDMILSLDLPNLRIFDSYSIKWDWVWCEQLCIKEVVDFAQGCEMWNEGGSGHKRNAASYPDVSLSRWKCARKWRREGDNGRDGPSPAVCTLPLVPSGSSPVTRVSRSPLRCEKRSALGGGWTQWIKSGRRASKNCIEKQHSPTLHKLWTLPYLHKKNSNLMTILSIRIILDRIYLLIS